MESLQNSQIMGERGAFSWKLMLLVVRVVMVVGSSCEFQVPGSRLRGAGSKFQVSSSKLRSAGCGVRVQVPSSRLRVAGFRLRGVIQVIKVIKVMVTYKPYSLVFQLNTDSL